jgi:hypothetical protein
MLLRFELDVGYGRVGGAHDIKSFEFDSLRMCISSLFQRLPARLDHHIVQSVSQRKLSLSQQQASQPWCVVKLESNPPQGVRIP